MDFMMMNHTYENIVWADPEVKNKEWVREMSHLSYLAKRFYRTRERLTEIKRKIIPVVSFFVGWVWCYVKYLDAHGRLLVPTRPD